MHRLTLLVIAVITTILAFLLFIHKNNNVKPRENLAKITKELGLGVHSNESERDLKNIDNKSKDSPFKSKNDSLKVSKALADFRTEASNFFYQSEANRSTMLFEEKKASTTLYMLAVRKPSSDEISDLRAKIKKLQDDAKTVSESAYQEFDRWVGVKLDRDDPFGIEGNKIIMIFIPDDPSVPMSGMTYPVNDFDSELAWIKSNPSKIQKENATFYSQDGRGDLERFRSLIVK
ncbi:MAG: hypothetical protein RLZZ245_3846 [Verrucomicrobiota bacterium]|jgi:hypothetical protein